MDKQIFIPGKITGYGFCTIFIIGILIAIFNSPFKNIGEIGNGESNFSLGYPKAFFELNATNIEASPFLFKGIIFDLLIYFMIAYMIDLLYSGSLKLLQKKQKKEQINKVDLIRKAKKAYEYYRSQGMSEENVFKLFQENGWTEENFVIYLKEIPENK